MRVVLDANIIISALISRRGLPNQLLQLWREEAFTLLISPEILQEIAKVIRYPKLRQLHQLTETEIETYIQLLEKEAILITPHARLSVSEDESDNRYIECAVAGGATYLVTGDKKHLLSISEYQGVKIVTAATFKAMLDLGM